MYFIGICNIFREIVSNAIVPTSTLFAPLEKYRIFYEEILKKDVQSKVQSKIMVKPFDFGREFRVIYREYQKDFRRCLSIQSIEGFILIVCYCLYRDTIALSYRFLGCVIVFMY